MRDVINILILYVLLKVEKLQIVGSGCWQKHFNFDQASLYNVKESGNEKRTKLDPSKSFKVINIKNH